jgi:Leucine-rich repeat (LRR) protein
MATTPLLPSTRNTVHQHAHQHQQSPPRAATVFSYTSSPSLSKMLMREGLHAAETAERRGGERSRANAHVLVNCIELRNRALECLPMDMLSGCHVRIVHLQQNSIASLLGSNLTRLAHHCGWRTTLCELDLSQNLLTTLPDEFGLLANLHRLSLVSNRIAVFPTVLFSLFRLQYLDLSANRINVLPPRVSSLSSLLELTLRENPLSPELLDLAQQVCFCLSVCLSHIDAHIDAHTRTYTLTHTHTLTHKHIHTHTHTLLNPHSSQ